jgi:5-formyltetrahydrofolate cyclo-ligase
VVAAEEVEAVLVPGAAWGEDGYRVGYGGGYYDRFLGRVKQAHWVGLGLEVQVVPEVPHGARDLGVDVLVTEERVRRFGHRGEG